MLEEELTKEAGKGIIGFFKDILGKKMNQALCICKRVASLIFLLVGLITIAGFTFESQTVSSNWVKVIEYFYRKNLVIPAAVICLLWPLVVEPIVSKKLIACFSEPESSSGQQIFMFGFTCWQQLCDLIEIVSTVYYLFAALGVGLSLLGGVKLAYPKYAVVIGACHLILWIYFSRWVDNRNRIERIFGPRQEVVDTHRCDRNGNPIKTGNHIYIDGYEYEVILSKNNDDKKSSIGLLALAEKHPKEENLYEVPVEKMILKK